MPAQKRWPVDRCERPDHRHAQRRFDHHRDAEHHGYERCRRDHRHVHRQRHRRRRRVGGRHAGRLRHRRPRDLRAATSSGPMVTSPSPLPVPGATYCQHRCQRPGAHERRPAHRGFTSPRPTAPVNYRSHRQWCQRSPDCCDLAGQRAGRLGRHSDYARRHRRGRQRGQARAGDAAVHVGGAERDRNAPKLPARWPARSRQSAFVGTIDGDCDGLRRAVGRGDGETSMGWSALVSACTLASALPSTKLQAPAVVMVKSP